jgi:hypothetical protein
MNLGKIMRTLKAWPAVSAAVLTTTLLLGCSSSDGLTPDSMLTLSGATGYKAANALDTTGHSETEQGPDHYLIRAKGNPFTPPERLEQIALARAAELGAELKYKAYRASAPVHDVVCGKAKARNHKSDGSAATRYRVVEIDVLYVKELGDPTLQPTAAALALIAALDTDQPLAAAQAAARNATQAKCGS